MIQVFASAVKPDEVEMSITVRATLADLKAIREALEAHDNKYPFWHFCNAFRDVIHDVEKTHWATREPGEEPK